MAADLQGRLAAARLFVLDVDGVLTDGRVVYGADAAGETIEVQRFDAKDGLGLNLVREAGVTIAWITGRGNPTTARRAAELGVQELHMRSRLSKAEVLADMQARHGIAAEETIVMGDDLIDLSMAPHASMLASPSDAHAAVRERADLVTIAAGGRGAVREVCDAILVAKGLWDETLARFEG